jgi:hypothetical protein
MINFETAVKLALELPDAQTYIREVTDNNYQVFALQYINIGERIDAIVKNGKVLKHRQYLTPVGFCSSVTTILNATRPPESQVKLDNWRKRTGEAKATKILSEACERGTATHTLIEKYLKGEITEEVAITFPFPFFLNLLPTLKLIRYDWYEMEKFTFSSLGYAGRLDLIADYNGKKTVFDWKTSNKRKKESWMEEAFLQATAYAMAENERLEERDQVAHLCICVSSPEDCQIFFKPIDEFKTSWVARVNQFKKERLNYE